LFLIKIGWIPRWEMPTRLCHVSICDFSKEFYSGSRSNI
jgi:hypothetical protein